LSKQNQRHALIVVADGGRTSVAPSIQSLVDQGSRVLALDPFYFGESKIASRDWLFSILLSSLGQRPLGLQAGQLLAAAHWIREADAGSTVSVQAYGPRSSLYALIAAAVDPQTIQSVQLHDSLNSLRDILDRDWTADKYPELFPFGLLERFDVPQIADLAKLKQRSAQD